MAKRKTPKSEKIIDLKPEKITDEQLENLQKTVNNLNRLQLEIGIMESQKHELIHKVSIVKNNITLMQTDFEKEYGTYDVDVRTGTINYPKENGKVNKKD